jgi:hypothetical protein
MLGDVQRFLWHTVHGSRMSDFTGLLQALSGRKDIAAACAVLA